MLNFKNEYFTLEKGRLKYPTQFKDKSFLVVYGSKEGGITGTELTAHIYKIPENYYEINAGQLDFSNYPNGIENDFLTIRVTNLDSLFSLPLNFTDWKDISPENLTTTFEKIGTSILDIQKRLSEVAVYIDSGKPDQINLPKLPVGCTWYKDQDENIVALPISDLYSKFNIMIDNLKKILADYIESKKEEISGATFFPHLMEDGTLSWTNDKNKPNPEPVNIKGAAGTIENVTASVNSNAGVPSVKVTMSGTKENRSFNLEFQNLKGDKPIKGTDYYTPAEKEQFTTETIKLVTAEGNKVVEQVKNIVAGNPATSNALTLSGKTRVEFEQDVENIYPEGFELKKETKTGTNIFVDKTMKNIYYNPVPVDIYYSNRFDYRKLSTSVNSYNSNHTITRESNGLKVVRKALPPSSYIMNLFEYTSEFSGNLWFSCDVKAENVADVMVKISVNGVEKESIYGVGHIYTCVQVNANDIVKLQFYTCLGSTTTNEIYYSNIMLQYGNMTNEFIPYKENSSNWKYLTKTLKLDGTENGVFADWRTELTFNGKYFFRYEKTVDILKETLPKNDDDIGDWSTNFTQITAKEFQNGKKDGIGFYINGVMALYIESVQSRANLVEYLKSNPITITYKYAKEVKEQIKNVSVGDILVSDDTISLTGYCKKEIDRTINYVAMGDSITGMFSHATSYPEMIEIINPKIKSYNCGFSGSQVTDHSNANYRAFSFNRLVESIISKDWTTQDNAINSISTANYKEHLAILKTIDFSKVDYLTLFYGTNDWGSSVSLDTFKSVYISSIKTLLTKYPNLKIIVISPYWRSITKGKDSNIDANSNGKYLYEFSNSIEELAKNNFNCPTLNLYYCLGANAITNRYYTQDGTHPTFSTRIKIAEMINKLLI